MLSKPQRLVRHKRSLLRQRLHSADRFVNPLSWGLLNQSTGNSSFLFCVAKLGAERDELLNSIDWACGQDPSNCSAIHPVQPCYLPNTTKSHASYGYNDYYQRMKSAGGSCDFGGTATTTSIDPSHGTCKFMGSSRYTSTFAFAQFSANAGNSVLPPLVIWALMITVASPALFSFV